MPADRSVIARLCVRCLHPVEQGSECSRCAGVVVEQLTIAALEQGKDR